MSVLSRADEILMLTILRLKDNAYGVSIIKEVYERTGKKLKLGGLWVSLDNLYKRGYVKKRMADPEPKRGGRKKIYYLLTSEGIQSLQETKKFQSELWKGASVMIRKTGCLS